MPPRPVVRLLPVACLALVPGSAPPATTAAPIPTHLMPKDPPLAFPTRVGTTWVHGDRGDEKTVVISRVEDKDGATLVTTELVGDGGRRTPHMIVSVSAQGVFRVAESGSAYDPPWCVLKLPHREGQKWEAESKRQDGVRILGTMTAGPWESVKVPAGEFRAVRVDWEYFQVQGGKKHKSTFWYADGVGLIRLSFGQTWVLKSFTPGKE